MIAGLLVGAPRDAARRPRRSRCARRGLLVLLPGLVFEAAYRLRLVDVSVAGSAVWSLAIPGVLVSAAIVAIGLNSAPDCPSSSRSRRRDRVGTDPAAVVATFKRLRVPVPLSTIVDGESLLNEGPGLVLFAIAVGGRRADRPGEASASFVATVAISVVIGLAAGSWPAPCRWGTSTTTSSSSRSPVVLAYGSYLLADELGLSGVIATVTARDRPGQRRRPGPDADG